MKEIGFDESFKILAKHFFSEFSKVITDFEIMKLPRKADVLVIETDRPLTKYVRIFSYFKTFNIIEFKSIQDPFRMQEDLPKILVYTGGLLLNENKATLENTTFTLMSSRKPEKLFKAYEKYIQKIKNGVYLIQKIVQVPVYIVFTNEVEGVLDKELAFIKEFSTGTERVRFIENILHEVLRGKENLLEYLHFSFSLYRDDVNSILEKEGLNMTIVEKNIRAWVDQLGLKDKYIKEAVKEEKLHIAGKLLAKGLSIEDIMDTTELPRKEILKLQKNLNK